MYQKHREVLEVVNGSSTQGGEGELTENELAFDGTTDLALTSQQAVLQHDDTRPSALFLLKAKTVYKVSNTALNDLIGDISILLESRIQSLQEEISTTLDSRGLEFDPELALIFQKPSLTAPFQSLHSEFLRKKFFREKMGLLVSVVCMYHRVGRL